MNGRLRCAGDHEGGAETPRCVLSLRLFDLDLSDFQLPDLDDPLFELCDDDPAVATLPRLALGRAGADDGGPRPEGEPKPDKGEIEDEDSELDAEDDEKQVDERRTWTPEMPEVDRTPEGAGVDSS